MPRVDVSPEQICLNTELIKAAFSLTKAANLYAEIRLNNRFIDSPEYQNCQVHFLYPPKLNSRQIDLFFSGIQYHFFAELLSNECLFNFTF